mgnify:CR=1 FL=1|tara:strand:- start:6227 stop:8116 length:1890 start_codon:yes stop_codon:yes gene_type:complete
MIGQNGQLRLLLLDDDPSLRDGDGFPCLGAGYDYEAEACIKRNFELEWLFDEFGANAYFQSLLTGRALRTRGATEALKYAHIVIFDYRLNQSSVVRQMISQNREARTRATELDPLREGGSLSAYADRWLGDATIVEKAPEDFGERSGCQLGTLIWLANSGLPSVGIPQTVTKNSRETAALEWAANITTRGAYDKKGGMLRDWMSLFARSLPRLRNQLIFLVRTGLVTVDISELLAVMHVLDSGNWNSDSILTLSTSAGVERVRLEALCFDLVFEPDSDGGLYFREEPDNYGEGEDLSVTGFLHRLATECASGHATEIGQAIRLGARFVHLYESHVHLMRRDLSRELHQAWSLGEGNVSEETLSLLREWELDPVQVQKKLAAGKSVFLPVDSHVSILGSIKDEADDDLVARYTAIYLAIYTEKVRAGLSAPNVEAAARQLVGLLAGDFDEGMDWHWATLEELNGVWLSETEVSTARKIARSDMSLVKKIMQLKEQLGNSLKSIQHALGLEHVASPQIYLPSGGQYDERSFGAVVRSRSINDLLDVYYHVASPSPRNLLQWSERKKGQEADVTQPLRRLGDGLIISPKSLFSGTHENGLQPGEGRIIAMIALQLGFDRQLWPAWMAEGEKR